MPSKALFLRVGVLVLLGLIGAVSLVLFLTRNRVSEGLVYETYFKETVQGLDTGSPVKFRGVTLGQVKTIGLVSALYAKDVPFEKTDQASRWVYVRYVIDPSRIGRIQSTAALVAQGLRVRLASQGLTGLSYMELDFVDPQRFPAPTLPWKPDSDFIPSMPSTLTQVQDAAQAFLARMQSVDVAGLAASVQRVLDDVHQQFATGDVHTTLTEANALLTTVRGAVEQAHLPALAADLRAAAGSIKGVAEGKPTLDLIASAALATDRLAAAAAKLPAVLASLDAAIRRANNSTGDVQADLAPALRDARAAAANLRETTEALRRYPAGTLFGGPPPREDQR